MFKKWLELEIHKISKLSQQYVDKLNDTDEIYKVFEGFSTGFKELDSITKKLQPSNLILVGGVVGMGKTGFALSLIRNLINQNHSVGFFSLQSSAQMLLLRMISQETGINVEKLRLEMVSDDEKEQIENVTNELKEKPLAIFDYPFLTVSDIEDQLDNLIQFGSDYCNGIIVIDSLELIAYNDKDKVGKILNKKELAYITYQLKKIAKKLNITIIATVNLDGKNLRRYYKRLYLTDLREYAPIDKYADLILFLFRPEYYKIEEWDDEEWTSAKNQAEISIAKNNNGGLGSTRVNFDIKTILFKDL